jgi:hypothetical protein
MATYDQWSEEMTQGVESVPIISGWKLGPTVFLIVVLTSVLITAMYQWPVIVPVIVGLWFGLILFVLAMLLLARKRIVGNTMEIEVLTRAIRGSE